MRPVEIEVRGFTCFRSSARVDFRGLDLFAITGPTGAGKTSLLEAMIYALYGRSPRVSNEVRHLLSLGAEKALVDLTFSSGKSVYRVVRTFNKAGKTEARIEQKIDEKFSPLASGSRDVTATAERLLGLDFDAFVRTVVLPQGRFDEFLKGQASDRQKILTSLLDLSIYEKMRQRASEILSALESRLRDIESRIAELGYATDAALEEEKQRLITQENEAARLVEERQRIEADAKEAKEIVELSKSLRQARQGLEKLRGEEGRIEEKRLLLARAKRALPLVPLWRQLSSLQEKEREERAEAHVKEEATTGAQREVQQAEAAQKEAQKNAAQLPALEAEIAKLREAVTTAQLHRAQTEELNRASARAKAASQAETSAQKEMNQKRTEAEACERKIEQLRNERSMLIPAPEAIATLKEATRAENEYAKARSSWLKGRESFKASEESLKAAQAQSTQTQQSFEAAAFEVKRAEEEVEKKKSALDAARLANLADSLRRHLHTGATCPVCLNTITELPPPSASALDQAEEAVKTAQAALKVAIQKRDLCQKELTEASANLAAQSANLSATQKNLETARELGEERAKELERLLTTLREELEKQHQDDGTEEQQELSRLMRELKIPEDKKRLKGTLEEVKKHLESRAKRAASLEEDTVEAEAALHRIEEETARLSGRVGRAAEERAAARADEARLTRAVEALAKQLSLIGDAPEALLEERSQQKEKISQDVAVAAQQLELARARAKETRKAFEVAEARVKQLEAERQAIEKELTPKLLGAGFSDAQSLSAAVLSEEETTRYAADISEFDRDLSLLTQEEKKLSERLGGRHADMSQVDSLSLLAVELSRQEKKVAAEIGGLTQRIKNLSDALFRKQQLIQEEKGVRTNYERTGRLAQDLRGDKFQAFVLDEAFRFLAEDGSKQIHRLSAERYTFAVKDREFYVLDHWNAAEARTVRTLSGGETFLASLALSVALAERIHDLCTTTSGDRMLESLFLDEGFGTLDPESLDVVIGALEELRTSGRMVGVISHVADLTARLPSRVIIEKGANGSAVTQEGGG